MCDPSLNTSSNICTYTRDTLIDSSVWCSSVPPAFDPPTNQEIASFKACRHNFTMLSVVLAGVIGVVVLVLAIALCAKKQAKQAGPPSDLELTSVAPPVAPRPSKLSSASALGPQPPLPQDDGTQYHMPLVTRAPASGSKASTLVSYQYGAPPAVPPRQQQQQQQQQQQFSQRQQSSGAPPLPPPYQPPPSNQEELYQAVRHTFSHELARDDLALGDLLGQGAFGKRIACVIFRSR